MTGSDAIKSRILEIVGSEWIDASLVGAAVLTTKRLKLLCDRKGAIKVAAYIYELRVTGKLEARAVGNARGFNQVRLKQ